MVTVAKIRKVLSDVEYEVYIPAYGKIEEDEGQDDVDSVQTARITSVAGCWPKLNPNDTVYVCIEDNKLEQPIIIGSLVNGEKPDINKDRKNYSNGVLFARSTSDASFDSLKVDSHVVLTGNTYIGTVQPRQIARLGDVTDNIQAQFNRNLTQKEELLKYMTDVIDLYFPEETK